MGKDEEDRASAFRGRNSERGKRGRIKSRDRSITLCAFFRESGETRQRVTSKRTTLRKRK